MMSMSEFDFTLLLEADCVTEKMENDLYEAGCDDATIALRMGRVYLSFTREGPTLADAIQSAIIDVKKAGFTIRRIDTSNLITQAEIAQRIRRSRQYVGLLVRGKRGPGGFPAPVCHLHDDDAPMWSWFEVVEWLHKHDMISESDRNEALFVDMMNSFLDLMHQRAVAPAIAERVAASLGAKDLGSL